MTPQVLHEDELVLVLNKPAGLVVNNAESVKGETVQEWVKKSQKLKVKIDKKSDFFRRSGVVHRLDKETSGALLVAKTLESFQELQRQFKDREVEKTYLALVHGIVKPPEGTIRVPIGRLPWNRERFGVLPGGRTAETKYKVIKHFKGVQGAFSLVEFYPKTGRTHQIRVHAKSLGHAVVADQFYAGRKTSRLDRKWVPRLFLHASKLTFAHPETGKKMTVEVPLSEDLETSLTALGTDAPQG